MKVRKLFISLVFHNLESKPVMICLSVRLVDSQTLASQIPSPPHHWYVATIFAEWSNQFHPFVPV